MERLGGALADRYELEREIGRGGMATVYLARDIKHGRPVAIKVFHSELTATIGADRFNREVEIAARLQHPHILPVHDSGEADGILFYVMPYVDGESLEQLAERGEVSPKDALSIVRGHFQKEEEVLFSMARQRLDEATQIRLGKAWAEARRVTIA